MCGAEGANPASGRACWGAEFIASREVINYSGNNFMPSRMFVKFGGNSFMPSRMFIKLGGNSFMSFRDVIKSGWQIMARILGGVAENV